MSQVVQEMSQVVQVLPHVVQERPQVLQVRPFLNCPAAVDVSLWLNFQRMAVACPSQRIHGCGGSSPAQWAALARRHAAGPAAAATAAAATAAAAAADAAAPAAAAPPPAMVARGKGAAAAPAAAEARAHVVGRAAPQPFMQLTMRQQWQQQQQCHHWRRTSPAAPTPVVTGTHQPRRPRAPIKVSSPGLLRFVSNISRERFAWRLV